MKTDTQVRQDVIAALQWEPTVDAKQLSVIVKNGIVTLRGYVGSYVEKWDAGRATQRVHGVRGLSSEIAVTLSEANKRNDTDIASAVVNVLHWMSYLPKNCIKVHVDKAWITLSGEVEWEFQRQAIRGTVRFLIGVKGVIDRIVVKPVAVAAYVASRTIEQVTIAATATASGAEIRHAIDPDFAVKLNACGESDIVPLENVAPVSQYIQRKTPDESPALELDDFAFFIAANAPAGVFRGKDQFAAYE